MSQLRECHRENTSAALQLALVYKCPAEGNAAFAQGMDAGPPRLGGRLLPCCFSAPNNIWLRQAFEDCGRKRSRSASRASPATAPHYDVVCQGPLAQRDGR